MATLMPSVLLLQLLLYKKQYFNENDTVGKPGRWNMKIEQTQDIEMRTHNTCQKQSELDYFIVSYLQSISIVFSSSYFYWCDLLIWFFLNNTLRITQVLVALLFFSDFLNFRVFFQLDLAFRKSLVLGHFEEKLWNVDFSFLLTTVPR